ncbi:MAG: alpha/beta hydrolase [Methylococcaceae bacterium]|nr:alpha/beta hydrolase [Methylococcaceae bacterium]
MKQTTMLAYTDSNSAIDIQKSKACAQKHYLTPIILSASIALMLSGCATPVSVDHVDIQTAYSIQTASAISSEQLSNASSIVLKQYGLQDKFKQQPAVVLAKLHKDLKPVGDDNLLFALAELSLFHAQRSNDRAYYLASAVYAWSLLYPENGSHMQIPPTDPRFRLSYDIYNQAVTKGLEAPKNSKENEVSLRAGTYRLPFGTLEISVDETGMSWGGYPLDRFISTTALEVNGLRNRYHNSGIGVPLAASLAKAPASAKKIIGSNRLGARTKVSVTALLRFDNARTKLSKGNISGRIEVYSANKTDTVIIDGQKQPIESDPTAALAYQLNDSPLYTMEVSGFFNSSIFTSGLVPKDRTQDGLFIMQPYQVGKIPLVLVHGTASSPARWAELINELNGDPDIRARYQIWLFMYDSARGIGYSAGRLRTALTNTVHELDPDSKDPALQEIVVAGHSQGGLLTKLTVIDSGTKFWDLLSKKPFEQTKLSPEIKEFIQQSVFYTPLPFVKRVIFISTPQHGAMLATSKIVTGLVYKLVTLPLTAVKTTALLAKLATASGDEKLAAMLSRPQTSVDNMNANNPALQTLASIPVTAVPAHSIIAVEGKGPIEEGDDGVVAYKSAHIDEAVSELVVNSGHSCQSQPEVIEEVKRILFEHLSASTIKN